MRIGLLTASGPWGGAEIHTVQLARTLTERGHKVHVVCLTAKSCAGYGDRCPDEVEILRYPTPKEPKLMSVLDWLFSLSKLRFDACVLVKGSFKTGDWKLDLAARLRFANYLTIEHLTGEPIPGKTSRRHFGVFSGVGLWWYRERLSRFSRSIGPRAVVCVSDAVRKRLVADYRFPGRKVSTVRNGVDVERFRRDRACALACRRRWGTSPEAVVLGAVGRFGPAKGFDNALDSFQALLKRFPERDFRLVLVGEGECEQSLKAQAAQIIPAGRVTFEPFCDRPWEPLSALDAFVMPSLNEGLPLALLEAMACECCPVATAVGGIPEVLVSQELGWLTPAGDPNAFTEALVDAACCTPEHRSTVGRSARQHVLANFNGAVQFNALVDIIESVAGVPRRRHAAAGAPVPPVAL
jgi:glycosyltransferase involved in cell wall biosynthesis